MALSYRLRRALPALPLPIGRIPAAQCLRKKRGFITKFT
jgi:hypothetical protein